MSLLQNLLQSPTINQIAIADKEGNLTFSAVPLKAPLNIAMREHFQAQIGADTKQLYIAAPWLNRATGTPSIFLSRRVNDSQGNFAGIVAVGLRQDYLETVFSGLGLGEGDSIVLLRRDSIFLSRVPDAVSFEKLVHAYRSHMVFDFIAQGLTEGPYESKSKSEGKEILGAFRAMDDYPLVILVGTNKGEALGSTMNRRQTYLFWAGLSSLLLLTAIWIIWYQIRRQYETTAALNEERSLLGTTLASMQESVIVTDETGKIRLINKPAQDVTGWTQANAAGNDVSAVLSLAHAAAGETIPELVGIVLATGKMARLPAGTILLTRQEQKRPIAGSFSPIVDMGDNISGVVINFHDLTEKLETEHRVYRDPLTGAYNRRFFEEEWKRAIVGDNLPLSLIVADIDGLKTVNDTQGHQAGDDLIVKTAQVLQSVLRQGDIVARIGGDEFAMILWNTSREGAEKVISRMMEGCAQTSVAGQTISCSFGCAEMRSADENITDLMAEADARMYEAKRRLKGQK